MYLNKVTLMGYLAHDAESRTSRDGRPYAVLDLAYEGVLERRRRRMAVAF